MKIPYSKLRRFTRRHIWHVLLCLNAFALFCGMPETKTVTIREKVVAAPVPQGKVSPGEKPLVPGASSGSAPIRPPVQSISAQMTADYSYQVADGVPMLSCGWGKYFKRGDQTMYGRIKWIGPDYFETEKGIVKLVERVLHEYQ